MLRLFALLGCAAALVAGCSSSGHHSQPPGTLSPPGTTSSGGDSAASAAINACYAKDAASKAGDIIVRMVVPGLATSAQQLGGGYSFDHTTNTCVTSTELVISTAPTGAGYCTQVAEAADNPGYNVDATPAKPLHKVVAQAGPAC